MANSGKNSNTSQFFIVLTGDEGKLTKLQGKYVLFGEVTNDAGGGLKLLEKIDAIAPDTGETPKEKIWIGECGVLQ
jgi:cyclophilin family peptidyl-prolyl cis-trans isomerase